MLDRLNQGKFQSSMGFFLSELTVLSSTKPCRAGRGRRWW
ncbi:hypothetical protein OIU77_000280 [Salix suchowensis]|uniref:Uncharacterized protein n=1 Tax=Salix suchowensis TaxID=1278906 RepID=A0ABQ9B7I6_9ROSI|nr:hypothetical protein OIU77_000280 [Salix suchowensis]KAJ6386730.1 hypothetical protein OIU78_016628 [Salix suchowensis]